MGRLFAFILRTSCPIDWAKGLNPEEAFGDVLRAVRRERKLSQEALALDAGIERNYVSLLELGKSSASIRMLFKLCTALEIAPTSFVRRVEARLKQDAE